MRNWFWRVRVMHVDGAGAFLFDAVVGNDASC